VAHLFHEFSLTATFETCVVNPIPIRCLKYYTNICEEIDSINKKQSLIFFIYFLTITELLVLFTFTLEEPLPNDLSLEATAVSSQPCILAAEDLRQQNP